MSTTTALSDIRIRGRVIHPVYRRGQVVRVDRGAASARVHFEGDRAPRTVLLRDLVPVPIGMPAVVDGAAS